MLTVSVSIPAVQAQAPVAWKRWQGASASSTQRVDHRAFDRFLKKYVVRGRSGVNLVRYGSVSAADRQALRGYLSRMSQVRPTTLNRREQMAYWINVYNAVTLDVVLQKYPVRSIRQIGSLFSRGPWKQKLFSVGGVKLSLDDIEHRILRPIFRDPRIHYGVNCASIGCPNLQRTAFTGANLNRLLNKGAREYVNHPRGARVDRNGRLRVSSIYRWFKVDFGGTDAGVIRHLSRYAGPALKAKLATVRRISSDGYDWSINKAGN